MNILFVCSGNTCRSAMAEAIAQKLIQTHPQQYGFIQVASAGTAAYTGTSAAAFAQDVAMEHGDDLSRFTSQQISPELVTAADVVLCMTTSHKRTLQLLAPQATDKIYLLKDYAHRLTAAQNELTSPEIADPFGGNKKTYTACYRELSENIEAIFAQLAANNKDLPNF